MCYIGVSLKGGTRIPEDTSPAVVIPLRTPTITGICMKTITTITMVKRQQARHPKNHLSFYVNHPGKKPFEVIKLHGQDQVLWPPHCIQCMENAQILIDTSVLKLIAQKGMLVDWDSYSGFYVGGDNKTILEGALKDAGIDKLLMFGIATDYCVKSTAIDGAKLGFKVTVVKDLCRGVDRKTIKKAVQDMAAAGVTVVEKLDEVNIK
jgi:nicotinamidase/pyrazinamidase